mgnify:FL=1
MNIKIYTLVDITETGLRKGPDRIAVGQQSNYDTLIQTIGLRANPEPIRITQHNGSIKGFGSDYKNKLTYWEFEFAMPEGSTSKDALVDDLNLVPIVSGLTENMKFDIDVFKTKDTKSCNIFFEVDDK